MAAAYSPRPITTAPAAPATPATRKLGPLQKKLSCQTFHSGWRAESAIAPATRPVLTTKCAAIAPTRGSDRWESDCGAVDPPSHAYVAPVATTAIASAAMLNRVQCAG